MAAGKTYEPIATTTLSSATNLITFSSIPGTYTDLVLVVSSTYSNYTTGGENVWVRVNNDSGSNYSSTYMEGGKTSGRVTNTTQLTVSSAGNNTSGFQVNIWNFYNYSNTTTYKSIMSSLRYAPTFVQQWANLWRNTAAINRIDVKGGTSGTFAIGSSFTLYGIAAA
jgi:hypothetical protein